MCVIHLQQCQEELVSTISQRLLVTRVIQHLQQLIQDLKPTLHLDLAEPVESPLTRKDEKCQSGGEDRDPHKVAGAAEVLAQMRIQETEKALVAEELLYNWKACLFAMAPEG
ncbi:unnamed protein product [Gadus morhua 'NCC']